MNPSAEYFENSLGFGYRNRNFISFFGNKSADLSALQNEFRNFTFSRIKQTHSDTVVESPSNIEADAHYTSLPNTALCISTADCMPIMIWCKQTHRTAAVHAGWRGVANKITEKTLKKLIDTGSDQKQFTIFVGPSIQQNSFEVERDVYEKIHSAAYELPHSRMSMQIENKFFVDLNAVLLSQIHHVVKTNASVTFSKIDTKTDLNYYSYRRDKETKERNLSFTCLLTSAY